MKFLKAYFKTLGSILVGASIGIAFLIAFVGVVMLLGKGIEILGQHFGPTGYTGGIILAVCIVLSIFVTEEEIHKNEVVKGEKTCLEASPAKSKN